MSDPTNRDGRPGDAEGVQPQQAAEDASTSVTDHDEHQSLVDDGDAPTAQLPQQDAPEQGGPEATGTEQSKADRHRAEADEWQRSWDEAGGGDIEPTVIAPSSLRGPSHDAEAHGSSLEQTPAEPADAATADAIDSSRATEAGARAEPIDPPELVEPRRPSLSLRGEQRPDLADTAPFAGLAGAGAAGAGVGAAAASTTTDEPAPTQAMPAQTDTQAQTQALPAQTDTQAQTQALPAERTEPQFEVGEPAPAAEQRTERLGSIPVDDETARQAATGTPIVLVETPTPPRKRGARGVGFAVVLLSTLVFGALLAVALLAVPYLFDRDFVLADALQTLWLQPSWLLPVAVFFVAYWLTTLIVNRAGWWAHVLGGFIIAVLAYAAHVAGLFLDTQDNPWNVMSLGTIELGELGLLLVLPTSIATFVVAREVPIWFGGIVSKRGRRAKQRNAEALAEYEAEQEARLAEYEATRA